MAGYYGERNNSNFGGGGSMAARSSSSSSSSSRGKNKGSSSSDNNQKAPKQPQRGLGVAQLEKIRLQYSHNLQLLDSNNNSTAAAYHPTTTAAAALHHHHHHHHQQQEDHMRVQTPYNSSPSNSSFSYNSPSSFTNFQPHQSIMMGMGDLERSNMIYGESQPSTRWNASSNIFEAQHYNAQPAVTRHLLNPEVEDSMRKKKRKDHRDSSMGPSNSQNSESNGSQELDLELRLLI